MRRNEAVPLVRIGEHIHWVQHQSYVFLTDSESGRLFTRAKRTVGPPIIFPESTLNADPSKWHTAKECPNNGK